jgi:PTH1 family peptidyl-tRNA hydrolase
MSSLPPSPEAPYLIVGLGNPGARYAHTRHNVGFMAVEELARRHNLRFAGGRAHSEVARGTIGGAQVILAKPQTYMNDSGRAVQGLSHFYKVPKEQVVVIYDDFALPLGVLRVREKGSAGGHNGLTSIIRHLGTNAFPRIRIGVDQPPQGRHSHVDWVLSRFTKEEQPVIEDAVRRAADAVESIFSTGIERTMNLYNSRQTEEDGPKKKAERPSEGGSQKAEGARQAARDLLAAAPPAAPQPTAASWIDRAISIIKGERTEG